MLRSIQDSMSDIRSTICTKLVQGQGRVTMGTVGKHVYDHAKTSAACLIIPFRVEYVRYVNSMQQETFDSAAIDPSNRFPV